MMRNSIFILVLWLGIPLAATVMACLWLPTINTPMTLAFFVAIMMSMTMVRCVYARAKRKHDSCLIWQRIIFVLGFFLFGLIAHISYPDRWYGNLWFYVILILIIAFFIYTLVAMVIWKQSRLKTECVPVEGYDLTDEIKELYKELVLLGFKPHGPPLLIIQQATHTCIPFISEDNETAGDIFINANPQFKPSVSFDSHFVHEAGNLGTADQGYSTRISILKNGLRQVFIDKPMAFRYQKHREAINYLKLRGIKIQSLRESNPIDLCIQEFHILNHNLRKNILKVTFFYLWRKSPRNCPFFGSVVDQKIAQRQIEYVLKKQRGYKE